MTTPDASTPPAVPPIVRTVAYWVSGVAGIVGPAIVGITAIVAPDAAKPVGAVVGIILGVVASAAGWLGVAFRPTAVRQ